MYWRWSGVADTVITGILLPWLLSAIVIFKAPQTPLVKSLKSKCSCQNGYECDIALVVHTVQYVQLWGNSYAHYLLRRTGVGNSYAHCLLPHRILATGCYDIALACLTVWTGARFQLCTLPSHPQDLAKGCYDTALTCMTAHTGVRK